MIRLKSCPLCGRSVSICTITRPNIYGKLYSYKTIMCDYYDKDCMLQWGYGDDEEKLAREWNKRLPSRKSRMIEWVVENINSDIVPADEGNSEGLVYNIVHKIMGDNKQYNYLPEQKKEIYELYKKYYNDFEKEDWNWLIEDDE